MKDRVKAIGFYARGETHWKSVCADTVAGIFRITPERIPSHWHRVPFVRAMVHEEFRVLSYLIDWKDAFAESPRLEMEWCNINNLIEFRAGLQKLKTSPLVVILHSAAWDHLALLRAAVSYFQDRRGKLLVLFGNEYHNMPEKIGFVKSVDAEYIASQLPLRSAQWLYAECAHSAILPAPQALNPKVYRPQGGLRPIDIGFRGDLYAHPYALGDLDRTTLLQYLDHRAEQWGLRKDIAFVRHPRDQWCAFLNSCKAVVGAESGTSYLERDDRTRLAVIEYTKNNPGVTFKDVYDRFFRDCPNPVSGKAISSRHFEPIGTKTCQILLDGEYNGILKADEHYIRIKKDLSNADEAIGRFKDEDYRRAMADRTYEFVMDGHTYQHRVEALIRSVLSGGVPSC